MDLREGDAVAFGLWKDGRSRGKMASAGLSSLAIDADKENARPPPGGHGPREKRKGPPAARGRRRQTKVCPPVSRHAGGTHPFKAGRMRGLGRTVILLRWVQLELCECLIGVVLLLGQSQQKRPKPHHGSPIKGTWERQRDANVERNRALLKKLGLAKI